MSERMPLWQNLERKHEIATDKIGSEALKLVDARYGSGYPLWKKGERELAYHNGYHSRIVGEAAVRVCTQYNMSPSELSFVRAIGYSHDVIQTGTRGRDERNSAEWFEERLEEARVFPESIRGIGGLAIRGTQPVFEDGIVTGQLATRQEYPNRRAEQIALGVACGDFGSLHAPRGPYEGHQYMREINGMCPPEDLTLEKMTEYQKGQVALLEDFEFPDPNGHVLATHKPQVIAFAHKTLRDMEAGRIETFNQLLDIDEAFARNGGQI